MSVRSLGKLRPLFSVVLNPGQNAAASANESSTPAVPSILRRNFTKTTSEKSKQAQSEKRRELDRLGTWDSRLDLAIMEDHSIRRGTIIPKIDKASVGVATHMGRRSYQEDRFTVSEPHPNHLLLAVWDGDGGREAAEFCAGQVEGHVMKYLETAKSSDTVDLEAVLRFVIRDLQTSFEKHWKSKPENPERSPGTTATVALLREGYELVVAQVGDSRAILNRDGDVRSLTKDHCPSLPGERERIEAAGGRVFQDTIGRFMVNKRLAMSRSIGDLDLKPFGVTAEPDITRISLKHGKDRYLVLTTDGVNFVMSDEEVLECLNGAETAQSAAEKLIDQALLFASEDNITVMVLPLGSWGKGDEPNTSVIYSLGRNMANTSRFS